MMIKPITSWGKYLASDCTSTGKPLSCAQFAFYVDHAAAAGGDGSQAKPWNNINLAFNERVATITAAYCTVTVYVKGSVTYFVGADTYSLSDYKSRGYGNRLRFVPWDQEYVDYHYAGVPRRSFIRVNSVAFERFRFDFTVELATTLSNSLYAIATPDYSIYGLAPEFVDCIFIIVIDTGIFTGTIYNYFMCLFEMEMVNTYDRRLKLYNCTIDVSITGTAGNDNFYAAGLTLFSSLYMSLEDCAVTINVDAAYSSAYGTTDIILREDTGGGAELINCVITATMVKASRLSARYLTNLRNCIVTIAGCSSCWFEINNEITSSSIYVADLDSVGEAVISTGDPFMMTDSIVSVSYNFAQLPGTAAFAAMFTDTDSMFIAENSSIAISATMPAGTLVGYGAFRLCPLRTRTSTYYLYNCDLSGELCIPGNSAEPDICSQWSCFGGYT